MAISLKGKIEIAKLGIQLTLMSKLKKTYALRDLIRSAFNIVEVDEATCKIISISIFEKTGEYVSVTTLKRIFGLVPAIENFNIPFVHKAIEKFTTLSARKR